MLLLANATMSYSHLNNLPKIIELVTIHDQTGGPTRPSPSPFRLNLFRPIRSGGLGYWVGQPAVPSISLAQIDIALLWLIWVVLAQQPVC